MSKLRVGGITGWLLLVMLLSLVPGVADADTKWKAVGKKVWLSTGQGISLATGGAGTDLVFKGDTIAAPGGVQVISGSAVIDWEMTPPQADYVTSLSTDSTVYKRVVVRLGGGKYAQVRLGMGSSSGLLYTGLFLEEWVMTDGPVAVTPILRGEVKLKLNDRGAQVNGVAATLDVAPRKVDGQVMVPLRFLGDALGLDLTWNARENKVAISGEGLEMVLTVGKRDAVINGESVTLAAAPVLVQNRLLVPMLGAGEALAGTAAYDAATGAITLGGKAPAPAFASGAQNGGAAWPAHFSAIWLNGYENGWISESTGARPDFYLTLNDDGSARVILTITGLIGAAGYPVNLEYKGTYTLSPLKVELKLQPALKGWETAEHGMPYWQEMTVAGNLAADMGKIEGLVVNGKAAKSGVAGSAKRVPEPGEWR